jgi:hypothetical protein
MESLIELVAASFARHGIECSSVDAQLGYSSSGRSASVLPAASPESARALPEHNYRKILQADETVSDSLAKT